MIVKNSIHQIRISGLNNEAQGRGYLDDLPLIVDYTLPGEIVEVKIIKVAKTYAIGKLRTILKASPERAQPFCQVFTRCGGCHLQHLSYQAQLDFKTGLVREHIRQHKELCNVIIHDASGMESPLHYRNKAQYPVGQKHRRTVMGFYAKRSHEIIEHSTCGIQDPRIDDVLERVRNFLCAHQIGIYDEIAHRGLLRHILIRVGMQSGEIMLVLALNGSDLPHKDELIRSLTSACPDVKSVLLNINRNKTNVILGDENRVIYGSETIRDTLGTYQFKISARSFYQVNPHQTEVLYRKAREYAELRGKETVIDLYCGIGTISLFLARDAGQVYGVESVEAAVRDARNNAALNNVRNVEFLCGTAECVLPQLAAQGVRADVVVVDPPRKGCERTLLESIIAMQPRRMVYVSCHPKTLARDLAYLAQQGFRTFEIQPVDMFPQTTHVECVAKISRET